MPGGIRLDLDEPTGVASITLQNPPLNVYDLAMRDELIEAIDAIGRLPDIRAAVVSAEGRHFSAGADLSEFGTASFPLDARRIRWERDPWTPLWDLPIPVIASLHGYALGAGLELALFCDIRVASPDLVAGLPEVQFGMLPAAGGTQTLVKAIGPGRALPILLTGRRFDASEALALGVIHEIVAAPDQRALDIALRLASADAVLVRAAKQQLHNTIDGITDAH